MTRKQILRATIMLLGGFAIAYNLTVALHELGHATTVLLGGGEIRDFVLNPFSWSWNLGGNIPDIRFTAWGGVTFGLAFTLIPLAFVCFVRSAGMKLMIKLLAACGLLINGIYLLAGVLFRFGDGGELAHLGVQPILIIFLGCVYMTCSLWIWSDLQFHLGLDSRTPFRHRLLVLTGGIAPYMLVILVYNLVMNPNQLVIWGGFASAGIVLAPVFALFGYIRARRDQKPASQEGIARSSIYFLFWGAFIIFAEFLIFKTPQHPF